MKRPVVLSASLALGLLLLGGCVSSTQYAAMSEVLKGSPALRRDGIRSCTARFRATPRQAVILAKLMNLKPGRDPAPVVCERVAEGIVSGRLSYDDYRRIRAGQTTPQIIRVLQGR